MWLCTGDRKGKGELRYELTFPRENLETVMARPMGTFVGAVFMSLQISFSRINLRALVARPAFTLVPKFCMMIKLMFINQVIKTCIGCMHTYFLRKWSKTDGGYTTLLTIF